MDGGRFSWYHPATKSLSMSFSKGEIVERKLEHLENTSEISVFSRIEPEVKIMTERKTFDDLVRLMDRLRDPGGCPWDREQNLATIKTYFLEEVYEAVEAIDENDGPGVVEELGDVLFEVVFLARLAREQGWGDVYDSVHHVHEKLVRRHPHVFGDSSVENSEAVADQWQKIKGEERKEQGKRRGSVLDGVPQVLPPLLQALRISQRAVAKGFEWPDLNGVLDKHAEEVRELAEAVKDGMPKEKAEEELGDILFTLVNVARWMQLDPHAGLMRTMRKFRRRFGYMEDRLADENKDMEACTLDELESLWTQAKKELG